ncbi:DUF1489 domain-containing protein [uncultured Methylovirgula sp.]|uniref:DUF1489 family protein n=1 Tax=uncultured Methylovirgula sp. TaxID=1285960 RepID=UPI0026136DB9|nr:DUF1489 domain-containing protein [uncultured Methylovirgula sp.]
MTLHLLKLCVGADTIADLEAFQATRRKPPFHVTRMVPRRSEDLLDGGSLYWVIKGQIAARQALSAIEPFTDGDGIGRCCLVLDATIVRVMPRPFRAFQGWRYLQPKDCPPDLASQDAGEMPESLRIELAALGLL